MIGKFVIGIYLAVGSIAWPLAGLILNWRVRIGKEDQARLPERFGIAGAERPAGPLVWFHAASVGETNAVLPLIGSVRSRGYQVLLTTGTVTSAEIAAQRLPEGAIHQYLPLDLVRFLNRFLDFWQPELAIFVESEIWPAAMHCLKKSNIPLALVNGRMSARSYRGWRRSGPVGKAVMDGIDICLAQTSDDARRFSNLGVRMVEVSGNLKFDVPAPGIDLRGLAAWQQRVGSRPVLVAASTHEGEEALVIKAHRELLVEFPDLLTIIVPRHPDRGEGLERAIGTQGLRISRRSTDGDVEPDTEIYLADTVGELGLWYRLGTIIVVGGSLIPRGGQNPIEPAKLAKPILHGPHIANFRDIFATLHNAQAVMEIDGVDELTRTVAGLLADKEQCRRLGERACQCVGNQTGALDRTVSVLSSYLPRPDCGRRADVQAS